jgi:hypothetical protein
MALSASFDEAQKESTVSARFLRNINASHHFEMRIFGHFRAIYPLRQAAGPASLASPAAFRSC